MIRRFPAGDFDRDHRIAPKLDGEVKLGEFGAIVYTYRLAMESVHQSNVKPRNKGRRYHPVDTPEEAEFWLNHYRQRTIPRHFEPRALFEDAWFIPTVRL